MHTAISMDPYNHILDFNNRNLDYCVANSLQRCIPFVILGFTYHSHCLELATKTIIQTNQYDSERSEEGNMYPCYNPYYIQYFLHY